MYFLRKMQRYLPEAQYPIRRKNQRWKRTVLGYSQGIAFIYNLPGPRCHTYILKKNPLFYQKAGKRGDSIIYGYIIVLH